MVSSYFFVFLIRRKIGIVGQYREERLEKQGLWWVNYYNLFKF